MKLRLFTVALLQAMNLYEQTLAVRLDTKPHSMSEAESSSMTEAETEVDAEAEEFFKSCVQKAVQDKIVSSLEKCSCLKDC